MFLKFLLIIGAASAAVQDSWVTRNGSDLYLEGKRWTAAGANVFWLGLDESVTPPTGDPYDSKTHSSYPTKGRITEMMNVLNALGANAIRAHTLGVNVGNPLSLMPDRGVINQKAFETIDWAVYQARTHGIRLLIPLTDNYDYYHGGKCTFLRWRGINVNCAATPLDQRVQNFFTDAVIRDDFKFYIKSLITHVNPYTNISYADDPTIFAYETGNELGGPTFQDLNVPAEWTQDIAKFIKSLAPKKLVVDGNYGINAEALSIPEVDVYDNHYYPIDNNKLTRDINAVGAANKVYFAGEYQWTGGDLNSWLGAIEAQQSKAKPVIAGSHFWSLFGHNVPNCDTFARQGDSLAVQYGDPNMSSDYRSRIVRMRQHLFKMRGQTADSTLPAVPCPGPESSNFSRRYVYSS